ncbi:MAG: glycogen synthase [Thermoanaerobaculia bacterium]|nr:glycogen synthase [Thermoanaerobaculia bacterium]
MEPLRICFAASEVAPFAKTGGLADVSAALPARLGQLGHDVRVFMPLHAQTDLSGHEVMPVDFLHHVPIELGDHRFHFSVFTTKLPHSQGSVDLYLIGCPQLFDRPGIYTGDWDEHLRFALFSRAVLECCQRMGWSPSLVHANDWHTALLPLYLRTLYAWDTERFGKTKTVLTIHNIAYQGKFPADVVQNLGLSEYSHKLYQDDLGAGLVNFLKTGILYADVVATVSRTYAREIQTEAFGEGLDPLLRARAESVTGIVNGADYAVWNPETDPHIAKNYGPDDVAEGKAACKRALMEETGLPFDPRAPVLGIVSRLTAQKGFELTFDPLTEALRFLDLRLVVVGSGEDRLQDHFHWLQRTFPHKVFYWQGYNEPLAHRVEAGADIFLMPSRFEPCGLNQMYSLKYGTVPIVRRTGGLADTVQLWNPETGDGNGFVFDHFSAAGLTWGLKAALTTWKDRDSWNTLRANGMRADYSWDRRVVEYEDLYRSMVA